MPGSYRILLALVIACAARIAGAESASLRVENSALALTIGSAPAPHVSELLHKASGRRVVMGPSLKSLFSLRLLDKAEQATMIESAAAKQASARVDEANGQRQLRLRFERFAEADLTVDVVAALRADDPLVRWSIEIDNRSGRRITSVRFPIVVALPALDAADDDFLVMPNLPGTLITNPAANWPASFSVATKYPGDQSAQFVAYQDRAAGVYMASMDTQGHPRGLSISKRPEGMQIAHEYVLSPAAPARWRSPYDVALSVTAGPWQQTADLYKRWAVQQPWCARTVAQRDDIPAAWKQGPCIHTCEVRKYNRDRECTGSYYPQLVEHMRGLRAKIEGPIVPMLAGWENHRRWTAGDYFPIFDDARARGVIAQLRKESFFPFFYLSGMFYTFDNEGRDGAQIPGAQRYNAALVIDEKTGQPKTYVLNESSPSGTWKRHSYQFCPAAPGTKEFFRAVLDQTHALGVDLVQMDQTTSGAADACYSTAHGHPVGPGAYQSRAFWDLLADMRKYGKSLSPHFVFMHEEPHEELIPYLDGIHTREYMEGRWYRGVSGARGIPLFTYLYHEYAIAYGGEGPSAVKSKSPHVVWQHAVNLVSGKTPAVSVWSNQTAMVEAHADQIHMLRNHTRLLRTEAQRFLMLGRMLHPLEFDALPITINMPMQRRGQWRTEPFAERAVLTSSWQSPDGLVGHLLVNVSDAQQKLQLQLDTRNAPKWDTADVDLLRADAPGQTVAVQRKASLPCRQELTLAPLEAVFYVLRPTRY